MFNRPDPVGPQLHPPVKNFWDELYTSQLRISTDGEVASTAMISHFKTNRQFARQRGAAREWITERGLRYSQGPWSSRMNSRPSMTKCAFVETVGAYALTPASLTRNTGRKPAAARSTKAF